VNPSRNPPVLLPLYVHPTVDPQAWSTVAALGGDVTVVVNVHNGPGQQPEPGYVAATAQLAAGEVNMLGYVDLAYVNRPLADILDDVGRWSSYPVGGIFFDQAPTCATCAGPVALATRVARRAGLDTMVFNPGVPTDPVYREMGATIVTFEGRWMDYQRWSGAGSRPGDGHLVYRVPAAQLPAARRLLATRRVGFGLATDRGLPNPYDGLPARLANLGVPR
jgi:hypothetical protein